MVSTLGQHIQVMNCNGKVWPLKNDVNFDLVVFGSQQKGKFHVRTEYDKKSHQWTIHGIELMTRNERFHII